MPWLRHRRLLALPASLDDSGQLLAVLDRSGPQRQIRNNLACCG